MKFKRLKFKNLLMSLTLSASLLLSFVVTVFADPFVQTELNARQQEMHPETLRPGRGEGKGKFAYIFQIHQSFNQEIQERGVLDEFGHPIPPHMLLYIIKLPNGAVYIKNHAMRTATGYSKSSINGYFAKLGLVTCDTKVYRKDLCERLAVPESTFAELRHWSLHITKELAERMSQPPQADSTGEDTQQSQVFGSPGSPVDMWPGPPEHAVRACPVHSPIDFGFMAGARPAADGPQGMTHVPNIGSYLNLYQWT
jgi:hypothetical protein